MINCLKIAAYLGAHVDELLRTTPFCEWSVSRTLEEDLPKVEIWYEFSGHGVEVICDETERIQTIFLHRGDGEALSELPFALSRQEVVQRFGQPAKSGDATRIPVLGDRGPWDKFALPTQASMHVQYQLERDQIDMITLMRADVVPE